VGAAFLVFAALLWWRGKAAAPVFAAVGAALALAAVVIPARLGPVQRAWMGLAHLISRVTTPIFMGVVYFVVLAPIGLLMRGFGRDPMAAKVQDGGYWIPRIDAERSDMRRQF
jgi:hypothetical protein